jgi:Rrf2 family protein
VAINITARIDYAVRAAAELAGSSRQAPRKLHDLSSAQAIPPAFLADILTQLRHAGVVGSQRGADGGYWLARPADELNLGEVMRAVEGSLMEVRGQAPDNVEYVGSGAALRQVWIILRDMLELVTIADLAAGELPPSMLALARARDHPKLEPHGDRLVPVVAPGERSHAGAGPAASAGRVRPT